MNKFVVVVRRLIVADLAWPVQLTIAAGCVAFAGVSRWILDQGANGVPLATFWPFMIVCAVTLDLAFAAFVAFGSVLLAFNLFIGWQDYSAARVSLAVSFFVSTSILLLVGQILRMTVRDLNRRANEYEAFNRELQHRARNTMQLIIIMASRGLKSSGPENFLVDFTSRVAALSKANEFLGLAPHRTRDMIDLVDCALAPFDQSVITAEGPPVKVTTKVGLRLLMALHELGTNATKYGALSCTGGRIRIRWSVEGSTCHLIWSEHGGPPVATPSRRGLGSKMLVAHPPISRVAVDFAVTGVVCEMEFPVRFTD